MNLYMVSGCCHGQVYALEADEAPATFDAPTSMSDPELGRLNIKYRLVHWDKQKAYYVPFAWEAGYTIKKLMEVHCEIS